MGHGARGARGQRGHRARRRPRRLHADAGRVARDPPRQRRPDLGVRPRRRHRGDAVAQPAVRRRLQVQPAPRRTGRLRRHVGDRRPRQRPHRRRARRRAADPLRAGPRRGVRLRLPRHLRRRPAVGARPRRRAGRRGAHRRRPARRRERALLGRDRGSAPPRPHRGEPAGRPHVAVHDARLGRQDPDGLLLAVGDGVARVAQGRVPDRHRQRRRQRPARHRHPGRRPDEPEPLPRRRHRLPVRRRPAGLAVVRADRQDARVVVDDRPRRGRGRAPSWWRCRWASSGSCPGCSTARSASAARSRRARRSSAATARCGPPTRTASCSPCSPPRSSPPPAGRRPSTTPTSSPPHGDPAYARIDAPADRDQKAKLAALSPSDVAATELAGEEITAKLTEAPGNGAKVGGLKVTTESAWFAARPSGTEDVYKIYAESFRGPDHLAEVQDAAREVVSAALG